MSTHGEVQSACSAIFKEVEAEYESGVLSSEIALGIRLVLVGQMMKLKHQPAAFKISREYAEWVGLDWNLLFEQIQARVYEKIQLARIVDEMSREDVFPNDY